MRCTRKFRQNGGVNVAITFESSDRNSMALYSLTPEEAKMFEQGKFYDFHAEEQLKRGTD